MRLLLAILLSLISAAAMAADNLVIERVSTQETGMPLPSAGIFMVITNNGGDADKLIKVASPRGKGEIHTMEIDDKGIMSMRPLEAVDIPAGGTAVLTPMGDHVMLLDVKNQMKKGEKFDLTLTFEKAGEKKTQVEVVTPDELSRLFPPELMADKLQKLEDIRNKQESGPKGFLAKLRQKVKALGQHNKPEQISGPVLKPGEKPPIVTTEPPQFNQPGMPVIPAPEGAVPASPQNQPVPETPTAATSAPAADAQPADGPAPAVPPAPAEAAPEAAAPAADAPAVQAAPMTHDRNGAQ